MKYIQRLCVAFYELVQRFIKCDPGLHTGAGSQGVGPCSTVFLGRKQGGGWEVEQPGHMGYQHLKVQAGLAC